MTCKTVTKRVGRGPLTDFGLPDSSFNCFLDMTFMKMVAPIFAGFRNKGQCFGWEKPLPYQFSCSILILFLQCIHQKHTVIVPIQITLVQVLQRFKVCLEFRENLLRKGNGSVFLSFAVMDG